MTRSRILYIFERADQASRLPVARAARDRGHSVTLAPIGPASDDGLENEGFPVIPLDAPAASLRMIADIRRILRMNDHDIVHAVTLKYAFITGLSTMNRNDITRVYTLAGLGYLFRHHDTKSTLLRSALTPLLRHILTAHGTTLIFQNPDDRDLMTEKRLANPARAILIPGSGVDPERFTVRPEPDHFLPLVLMPTRLVHEKGVAVFAEAARILRARGVKADFQIAGGETRHNPRAISCTEMEALTADGAVRWLGRVEDMPGLLARANLVVYPSYYGEGIPRVLLEACAAGRAIVTTDHPGCREAVTHGDNGLLVPTRDAKATADAIETLLKNPALRARMGARGRERAVTEFNVRTIAEQTSALYGRTPDF